MDTEIVARLDALDARLIAVEHMIFGGGPVLPSPPMPPTLDEPLAAFITHLYTWLLGRVPSADPMSVPAWVALLGVTAAIMQSSEFQQKHPQLMQEVRI